MTLPAFSGMESGKGHRPRPAVWRLVQIPALSAALFLLLSLRCAAAVAQKPRVATVEAFWEDSLAIIRPEILDPLDDTMIHTLRSGVPAVVEVEVRFSRTGYVKTVTVPVLVEYDVWTGWYRVTTPLSPLAIEELPTVLRLFEKDLVLPFAEYRIDPGTDWYVKVRVSTAIHEGSDGDSASGGVAEELTGMTRFVFHLFDSGGNWGPWSELVKLPRRGGNSP